MSTREAVRPAVSVVVPFAGDAEAAARVLSLLARLELARGDEVLVADNSAERALAGQEPPPGVRVIEAREERSSYHARNVGAAQATGEWLVFIDSDCRPDPDLLERYFVSPPGEECGALAGAVVGAPAQAAFLARYARSRNFLDQADGMHTHGDAAATANLAVRRSAFEAIGGFEEGIRSGGDVDLCRRLRAAGWTLERRLKASVEHLHRERLAELLGSIARYSAGARWLNDRYPGSARPWPLAHGLALCARDITVATARGHFESAAFRGVDALGLVAHVAGYRFSNRV